MSLLNLFKIVCLPILLPLSVIYGLCSFVIGRLHSLGRLKLSSPVISVGNFCVGGSGKTPVVVELIEIIKQKGLIPVVISKSYKASLEEPAEVLLQSKPTVVGDEALSLKKKFNDVHVFSGPVKYKTAAYAQDELSGVSNKIFIIDDGAQHHKVYKDIKIHVWDLSRALTDVFPFPFGASREFWFLGETADVNILNRVTGLRRDQVWKMFAKGRSIEATSRVNSIRQIQTKKELNEDFILISGIGNFKQLSVSVGAFVKNRPYKLNREIQGRDHDDFKWFKSEENKNYVCTEKDEEKLKYKISTDRLYIVTSEFTEEFKKTFKGFIDEIL